MRSPRFQTDAYQESAEAKYEKKAEDMIKSFTKKIKHIFTIKKGNK
jgi:hypothetical protein